MTRSRLTDTVLKKAILVVGVLAAVNSAGVARAHGVPLVVCILLGALNLLLVRLTLYQLTCLRDGGCNVFSLIVGVLSLVASSSALLRASG